MIQRYLSKVSGPLPDRIDLHIEVPAVPYKELRGKDKTVCRRRICPTAWKPRAPFNRTEDSTNSRLLRSLCALDDAGERTLEMAVRKMALSARAHDRILKVARTIADLDGAEGMAACISPKRSSIGVWIGITGRDVARVSRPVPLRLWNWIRIKVRKMRAEVRGVICGCGARALTRAWRSGDDVIGNVWIGKW